MVWIGGLGIPSPVNPMGDRNRTIEALVAGCGALGLWAAAPAFAVAAPRVAGPAGVGAAGAGARAQGAPRGVGGDPWEVWSGF